jgi:hypothetical protein
MAPHVGRGGRDTLAAPDQINEAIPLVDPRRQRQILELGLQDSLFIPGEDP